MRFTSHRSFLCLMMSDQMWQQPRWWSVMSINPAVFDGRRRGSRLPAAQESMRDMQISATVLTAPLFVPPPLFYFAWSPRPPHTHVTYGSYRRARTHPFVQ
ncbi:unnamed protein product [Arctia plantaginis]|uniref:Uncharacterized protein n=1 Tax=Arctia plantaginis TaxID=874455 RepID=A0A8S1BPW1_ARCPL|nr:unnamed protein product [Arctia plantaginis]CAB3260848.1 unnamed protein product [Arctia plantaginis]